MKANHSQHPLHTHSVTLYIHRLDHGIFLSTAKRLWEWGEGRGWGGRRESPTQHMSIYLVSFRKKKAQTKKVEGKQVGNWPFTFVYKNIPHYMAHNLLKSFNSEKNFNSNVFFLCKQVTIKFSQLLLMRMDGIWNLNCQTNSRELLSKDVPSYATQSCSNAA